MLTTAILVVVSLVIGASVGLSGIGGFLIVPAMILLAGTTVPEAVVTALLANLGAMTLTGLLSARQRSVSWKLFRNLSIGSIAGAMVAHLAVGVLPEMIARLFVAVLMAGMGTLILIGTPAVRARRQGAPHRTQSWLVGGIAQLGAVFAGIGGPAITVPSLIHRELTPEKLIGTALLHGVLVSTLGLVITARAAPSLDGAVVYVAVLTIGASLIAAVCRPRVSRIIDLRHLVGVLAYVGSLATLLRL